MFCLHEYLITLKSFCSREFFSRAPLARYHFEIAPWTHIQASSGIRTLDPSVVAAKTYGARSLYSAVARL
jgi:hypothetical protein